MSETSFLISFNQTNVVPNTNNSVYTFTFPSGGVSFPKGFRVALQSLSMYKSTPNITAANGNNSFSYIWQGATVVVTLPDGYYTIADINSYLQSVMVTNSHYLIDAGGDFVYYLEIAENSVLYAVQLNAYPIPTAAQAAAAGLTAPVGWGGYPAAAETPQFVIPNTNITLVFGLSAATYPAVVQATTYSITSTFTPQVSPLASIFLLCNLVENNYNNPSTLVYNFPPTGTYGSIISVNPTFPVYTPIRQGSYTQIQVRFVDQNYEPLTILDSNLTIVLSIVEPPLKI